jgi:hypothetical protein
LAVIVPNLFPSSALRGSTSFDVPSYDLEQATWSRFKLSGYGFSEEQIQRMRDRGEISQPIDQTLQRLPSKRDSRFQTFYLFVPLAFQSFQ